MKLIFNALCQDRYTFRMYAVGDVVEFEDSRAKEILKSGYADIFKGEKQNNDNTVDLSNLSKQELVNLAKEYGVAVRGSKEEIIERILSSDSR